MAEFLFKLVEELLRQVVVGFDASALDLGRRRRRNGAALRLRAGGGSARRAGGPLGGRGARRGGRRAALLTRCRARVAARGGFTTRDVVLATRRGSRTQSPQHHSNPPTRYMNRSPQAVSETLPQRHVILLVIGISLAPRKTLICTGGSAAGLWARPTVTIREWLRTVATIPPRCFSPRY